MRVRKSVLGAAAFAGAPAVRLSQLPIGPVLYSAGLVRDSETFELTGTRFGTCGQIRT